MISNNPIQLYKFSNKSIWPENGILIGTTTSKQIGPGSNGNEGDAPLNAV